MFEDVRDSPAFKQWFSNSKVVDQSGKPLEVYHGTSHDFDTFNKSKGDVEGYIGAAFYFTDESEDADFGYAGGGPDADGRISRIAEKYQAMEPDELAEVLGLDSIEGDSYDYSDEIKKLIDDKAKAEILSAEPKPNIMPVYLRMLKPFYINSEPQHFEYNYGDPDDPDNEFGDSDPTGDGAELIDAVRTVLIDMDLPEDSFITSLHEQLGIEGFTSDDFNKAIRNADFDFLYDAGIPPGELLHQSLMQAGYDGVIMNISTFNNQYSRDYAGTHHYVVFNSNQIKSKFNSNPTNDNRITHE